MNLCKRTVRFIKRRMSKGRQPDFIIVGAQKSGTTSLHYYLSHHPKLLASTPKEVRYFDRDDNYKKGKKWYHKAFVNLSNRQGSLLCFEATPEYIYRSYAAQRMYETYPDLKIIMILRDPVKRAFSAWNMYRDFPIKFQDKLPGNLSSKNGYIYDRQNNLVEELYRTDRFPTFEEVVDSEMVKINSQSELEEPSIIRRGIYLPQVLRFHELFGKDNVLILGFKDLVSDKEGVLNSILRFLDLEECQWNFVDDEKKNVRSYPEKMSDELEDRLSKFYAPHNQELFKYLGYKVNW